MPKITETIDLTKEEYEKIEKLRKKLNLSIHEFVNLSVRVMMIEESRNL